MRNRDVCTLVGRSVPALRLTNHERTLCIHWTVSTSLYSAMEIEGDEATQKPWETEYERSWEVLQEDREGRLHHTLDDELYKAKRRRLFERPSSARLGMMRYMFLILDASRSMADKDLKPDRLRCTLKVMDKFLSEFFDQNPISQVGLIISRDGKAEKLQELNGNSRVLSEALRHPPTCSGDPSLQNSLEMTTRALKHVPTHASKEAVIILGSITSCDPGNIFNTIDELVKQSVRCSIIGLSAEVRLCKIIAQRTQGQYQVITDEVHFRDIMLQHCRPPPAKVDAEASMIKMGFPKHLMNGPVAACLCHLDQHSSDHVTTSGYFCPRCGSKYCELPVMCKVCGLTLVLAPHLARSYHHLFPLPMFQETALSQQLFCTGCQVIVTNKGYVCPDCSQLFCIDCDLYIHETLHNCPGCLSKIKVQDATIATAVLS